LAGVEVIWDRMVFDDEIEGSQEHAEDRPAKKQKLEEVEGWNGYDEVVYASGEKYIPAPKKSKSLLNYYQANHD